MPDLDTRPLEGPYLDVYDDPALAWRQIGDTHPHALKIQGWPRNQADAVAESRRRWPDVRLALCPGVDGVARKWKEDRHHDRAIDTLIEIADGCVALGIGHLVYDPERAWKSDDADDRELLATIATNALTEVRRKHPTLTLGVTSYGFPARVKKASGDSYGGHSAFPWRGWLPGSVTYLGQTYDVLGKLVRYEALAIKSFEAAIERGMIAPGTVRLAEIQTHHNTVADLVTVGTSTAATFFWAAGSVRRFDAEGARGWSACLALWRAGFWGDGALTRFQAAHGITGDGALDATLQALGV